MNTKLIAIVAKIDEAAENLKPWPAGQVREAAIMEGLQIMLEESNPGAVLKGSRINTRGEFEVFAYPIGKLNGFCAHYGEKFAAALSKVPRRTGMKPYAGPCIPENGWCYVNHFDAEQIVREAAAS